MPRRAREKSSTGVYHVMLRGINRQNIFKDREDRQQFITTLVKYKKVSGYEIYGYCLMTNHMHLLIKEGGESIDRILKRIGASYVYWYNKKYARCGHLFQDRFKSEPVEDDQYLLVVLRY
ncbi:MAG: transposase, partial [Clostridia bacterium]|nr:transposase [Clostridia bacterium]